MSETLEIIKNVLVQEYGIDAELITDKGNIFSDYGFDSLDGVDVIMSIEAATDVEVPDEILERTSMTIAELVEVFDGLIREKTKNEGAPQ
ncbi:MAG: hypothetical protein JJ979_28025 [Roseibium sp.]|nr:hypothetical protein [Roseibium sp.]